MTSTVREAKATCRELGCCWNRATYTQDGVNDLRRLGKLHGTETGHEVQLAITRVQQLAPRLPSWDRAKLHRNRAEK